ncbi:MAG TPA: hypothetical protein VIK77_12600 [Tissierellaceae bacterium]
MTDKLKSMLDSIPVPEKLDEKMEIGLEKGRIEYLKRKRRLKNTLIGLAASFALIISTISFIGVDRVEAAIKRMLQYVPGYNVLVDKEEGTVFALKDEIYFEDGDTFVKIKAASKLNSDLTLTIESNYKNYEYDKGLLLKDEKNNILSPEGWGVSGGGEYWKGDFLFNVEGESTVYTLLVGNLEIPFNLEKTDEVENILKLGPYVQDKGITIVAIKKPMEDKLMISLLNKSEGKRVVDYPFAENLMAPLWNTNLDIEDTMYLIDEAGSKVYPSIPSSFGNLMSDFYFNTKDREGLKLVLPYVKVNYPDLKTEKIKIKTPRDGELKPINKALKLGDFEIEVINVRRNADEIIISLKANSSKDEIIDDVKIGGIFGYGMTFNEETGYTELYLDYEDVGRSFSIYFESPTTLLLGNWIIDLD